MYVRMTSDSRDSERRDQGSTDTHGAGDAFIGALAARWASGVSVVEAVRFANAVAALFVSTPADQKKTVTSDKVTRFLSERRQPMS